MHQFIAAFFAMVFSFSHAQTVRHSETLLASEPPAATATANVPNREELAHQVFVTTTSYAESSCVSCRRMNVVSNAR
jgi:hypothetical protein